MAASRKAKSNDEAGSGSKKNTTSGVLQEDELPNEWVELLDFVTNKQVQSVEISDKMIASAIKKFPSEQIVRLGDAMLFLEKKKKVLVAWAEIDEDRPRILDYARELDKQVPISKFTELEVQVITFFSDIYIECKSTNRSEQSDFPPAEEILNLLISQVLKKGGFPPYVNSLFEWGFAITGEYVTIFPEGYKNHSSRIWDAMETTLQAIVNPDWHESQMAEAEVLRQEILGLQEKLLKDEAKTGKKKPSPKK